MRNRLEDLGRLAVMLESMAAHELFEKLSDAKVRPKDFLDRFNLQSQVYQNDFIHDLGYQIESLRGLVYVMLEIANGEDRLNQDCEEVE
jgi:hypothetical protein